MSTHDPHDGGGLPPAPPASGDTRDSRDSRDSAPRSGAAPQAARPGRAEAPRIHSAGPSEPNGGWSADPLEPLPEGEEAPPPGVRAMALVRWALVILMAVVAAATVLYHARTEAPVGASRAGMRYHCPMHPSVVQDAPGDCPICGMTLVPVTDAEEHGHEHGAAAPGGMPAGAGVTQEQESAVPGLVAIELTPERIQLIGMRTARVTRRELAPFLRTVGFVAASEDGRAQVHTRFAGWIEELYAAQTGQHVSRGEVLATIYSPELLTAQQELLNARRWAGAPGDGTEVDRLRAGLVEGARRRLELLGIAREEVAQIERRGEALRALPLRSPVSGYVVEKRAVRGLYVEPGTTLFDVADLSTVWVLADVYEHELPRVRLGAEARLTLASYPGETFTGGVGFVAPTLDPTTRTLRVRLAFANPGLRLKPGMYGDVEIALPAATGLVAPRDAIVDTGALQYAFVAREGGRFEPRAVRVGTRAGDDVEVLAGLAEGDLVVTTGNFLLDSESRLRAAIGERSGAGTAAAGTSDCDREFDRVRYPEKYEQCRACELQHRGMGTMEADCKRAIPGPWR